METLEDICKDNRIPPPPSPPFFFPIVPTSAVSLHHLPRRRQRPLYIPDKTLSEGGRRRCWWWDGWWLWKGGRGVGGLQGHHDGTLLIALSAYANHQLSVSGRVGSAGTPS